MDKNKLFSIMLLFGFQYNDIDLIDDVMVNDCIIKMCFFMLNEEIHSKTKDELWDDFDQSYQKLSTEQQEVVKQEYLNIINAQDKNIKVKKKGNDIYE